jgi:hypothetical protein
VTSELNNFCLFFDDLASVDPMGGNELANEYSLEAVMRLADAVEGRLEDTLLARLWAAEQIRRATEEHIDDLLAEARRPGVEGSSRSAYTWERLGAVLGISPQGVRQRALRRRPPLDLHPGHAATTPRP